VRRLHGDLGSFPLFSLFRKVSPLFSGFLRIDGSPLPAGLSGPRYDGTEREKLTLFRLFLS